MFSIRQKREIAAKVQQILRETNHPELPAGEISFMLHVDGAAGWSWADIRNNGAVSEPEVNAWNEQQDLAQLIESARKHGITPEEHDAQLRSFAYGNTHLANQSITREDIDMAADSLKLSKETPATAETLGAIGECAHGKHPAYCRECSG